MTLLPPLPLLLGGILHVAIVPLSLIFWSSLTSEDYSKPFTITQVRLSLHISPHLVSKSQIPKREREKEREEKSEESLGDLLSNWRLVSELSVLLKPSLWLPALAQRNSSKFNLSSQREAKPSLSPAP